MCKYYKPHEICIPIQMYEKVDKLPQIGCLKNTLQEESSVEANTDVNFAVCMNNQLFFLTERAGNSFCTVEGPIKYQDM